MIFNNNLKTKSCKYCGYRMVEPFPKICPNPKCGKPQEETFIEHVKEKTAEEKIEKMISPAPVKTPEKTNDVKQFSVSSSVASRKIKGVKVKKKKPVEKVDLTSNVIVIPHRGQYFKNFGIINKNRVELFNRNDEFGYLCELASNLDFIASSILGGMIDRLFLIANMSGVAEKIIFSKDNDVIYFIYGVFPDKLGNWLLNQMNHACKDIYGRDPNREFESGEIWENKRKFNLRLKFIMEQYLKLEDVISDKEIPALVDWLRIDYVGMSYKSIGVISKLIGNVLDIKMPTPEMQNNEDLKESLITAKIEAIAANTIANTKATPKYLSVKLSYGKYRFLLFELLKNDYFLYVLSEGNIKKFDEIKNKLIPILDPVIQNAFKGDLQPFSDIRTLLTDALERHNSSIVKN